MQTIVSHFPYNGEELRVVRITRPPDRIVAQDFRDGHYYDMHTDRRGAVCLAAAWALAKRSPRSLIHLPIRANRPPSDGTLPAPPLDLVLVHASAQLQVSAWKAIRARTRTGLAHRFELGTIQQEFHSLDEADFGSVTHRDYPHHLRYATAAGTLFVIGSTPAFAREGVHLRVFVEDFDTDRPHHCAEIWPTRWKPAQKRRLGPDSLHVVREIDRWPARRRHRARCGT